MERAVASADYLLAADPARKPGLMVGTAGCAIFLLRLFERTGDDRYLKRAQEWGHHILAGHLDTHDYLGMGQGLAGIGHLGFVLNDIAGDGSGDDLVHRTAARLIDHAESDQGRVNWRRTLSDSDITRCHWRHGGAGVGQFFARAHERSPNGQYLDMAKAAGETTYAYGDDRQNPSQCHGLAGKAELFVDLGRVTGETLWDERLAEFVDLIASYRHDTADGERWQADEPGLYSPELVCGSSGVGHFLLRLIDPQLCMPFL